MARPLEAPLKAAVADEARRADAPRALGRVRDSIEALNTAVRRDTVEVENPIRRYVSTAQDLDRLADAPLGQRQRQMEQIWTRRAALLSRVTSEEWDQAMAAQAAPR